MPIRTPFAYDLDHAHTRTHTHNHEYLPPALIDFALRLLFRVEACATRSYIDAYGMPDNFPGALREAREECFAISLPRVLFTRSSLRLVTNNYKGM